jgi:ATP-dependent DNA ligase
MLPLKPPVEPMLATPVGEIPERAGMVFEPKWDGFRCLVFRDGDDIALQSRSGKPLIRFFPEMLGTMREALPSRCVVDGELVVVRHGRLSFDALTERVHPATSRINLLAEEHPASYVAFDLLALGDNALLELPFNERRSALEQVFEPGDHAHLTPTTDDVGTARQWFDIFEGAGLDGLIGKASDVKYLPGKRAMLKIKHKRTADCVVAGFRWHKTGDVVGSLLLGLYDDGGLLHNVGVCGAFPAAQRAALVGQLAPLRVDAEENHPWLSGAVPGMQRLPGAEHRWRSGEQPWEPLRCERVVEVAYEHTEGEHPKRFRLNPKFVRWRDDREPESCQYEQLDEPTSYDLDAVLNGEVRRAPST